MLVSSSEFKSAYYILFDKKQTSQTNNFWYIRNLNFTIFVKEITT